MELKMQTERVTTKKEKLSVTVEQIIENDMSLPDYYGDIVKILGCRASTNIYSAGITGDKAVIDGCEEIKMLYVNGAGELEIYECSYPFNRSVDAKDAAEGDCVTACALSEQINCRAVNQRRADIRGSVTLKITVEGAVEGQIIAGTDEPSCHMLKARAEGSFLTGCIARSFTLSETGELPQGIRGKKIFRTAVLPTVTEVRTIKNKLMVKGSVGVDAVVLTDKGVFAEERITLQLNQILDMEGIDETTQCCVRLLPSSVDVKLTPDAAQSPQKLEVTLIVTALIDGYKKSDLSLATEAYSSKNELVCRREEVRWITSLIKVNESFTVPSKMDFSRGKAEKILDAAVKKVRYTVHSEDNAIICKGNIHYGLVLASADGELMYFERVADFEYRKPLSEKIGSFRFNPDVYVNAVSFSINQGGEAEITAEIRIDGFIFLCGSLDALTEIEDGGELKRDGENAVITIYFAASGERLWDIAKAHGSSVEYIKELNGISEDVMKSDKMLIFPLE